MDISLSQFEIIIAVLAAFALIMLVMLFIKVIKIGQQITVSESDKQEHAFHLKSLQEKVDQSFKQFTSELVDAKMNTLRQQADHSEKLQNQQQQQHQELMKQLYEQQSSFAKNQLKSVDQLVEHLNKTSQSNREELNKSLQNTTEQLTKRFEALTENTDKRLKEISAEVEKRLSEGFEKTTKTFNDIVKRLALIDDAQKKITELSTNVVSLQEVLADKRSRGAFGEVQLNGLIRNVLPEQHFAIQHKLSNGKIADCVLFLPEPTGNVVIDAKFPLESYRKMADETLSPETRLTAERQFKQDIKKHIQDISSKYLIDNETADGAVMFIPAEAIFAEIHARHGDLVDIANQQRVWIASPTTLMAILTTARSVIKDEATRQQVHIIQEHLSHLAGDFGRFKTRFDNLAKHIDQAASDVKQIHTSANKISSRFEKIEQVDLRPELISDEVS